MGNTKSIPLKPNGKVCTLSVHRNGKLRLTHGTVILANIISDSIKLYFPRYVSPPTRFGESLQWKVYDISSYYKSIETRRLFMDIIQKIEANGWKLETTSDLFRGSDDYSTLFFTKQQEHESPQAEMLCLFPSRNTKLNIISDRGRYFNASDDHSLTRLQKIINDVAKGVHQVRKTKIKNGAYQLTLNDVYWTANGTLTVKMRQFMLSLLETLRHEGFMFHSAVDLVGGNTDISSIYLRRVTEPGKASNTQFVCISLNSSDTIRLIGEYYDEPTITCVKNAIETHWGLRKQGLYGGAIQFILKGTPWLASGSDAISSRILISRLFEAMAKCGWTLEATMTLTNKSSDKSTFFFQRTLSYGSLYPIFCLSLNSYDKIRLINCDPILESKIQGIVQHEYPGGLRQVKNKEINSRSKCRSDRCLQFQLANSPWVGVGYSTIHARSMMASILRECLESGWTIYSSADISGKSDDGDSVDMHSWFLRSTVAIAQEDDSLQQKQCEEDSANYIPTADYAFNQACPSKVIVYN